MAEEAEMEARIRAAGGDAVAELASLWDWLLDEDDVRGSVDLVDRPVEETELGGVFDAVAVSLGSGSAGVALCRALVTWLQTRRSDVTVTVSAGGRTVEVTATNLRDVAPVLERVLGATDEL
jgi:hypothetical protein